MPRRRTLIASAVAALAAPRAGMTQEAAGHVARLVGSGLLFRGGGSQPLAEGAALFLGDVVRTGLAAKVQIDCPDGLVVVVGPESEVRISDFSRGRGLYSVELMLELLAGIVRLVGPAQAAPRRVERTEARAERVSTSTRRGAACAGPTRRTIPARSSSISSTL